MTSDPEDLYDQLAKAGRAPIVGKSNKQLRKENAEYKAQLAAVLEVCLEKGHARSLPMHMNVIDDVVRVRDVLAALQPLTVQQDKPQERK